MKALFALSCRVRVKLWKLERHVRNTYVLGTEKQLSHLSNADKLVIFLILAYLLLLFYLAFAYVT